MEVALKGSGSVAAGTLEATSLGLGGVDCLESAATGSLRGTFAMRFRGYLGTGAEAEGTAVSEPEGKLFEDSSTRAFFFGGDTGGGETAGGSRFA